MANIEYASPFKSMIAGQTAALGNIEKAQAARQTNLDYRFNEWYQPLRQAEQQNTTASNLLKEAAAIAHYTGDYTYYNTILSHYLGVPPEALPQGYARGKGGAQQTKAADTASGLLPVPLTYPNVYMAGGVGAYPQIPGRPADPEIDALHRQAVIAQYNAMIEAAKNGGAAGGPVDQMDPTYGIAPPGTTTPLGPTAPVTSPPPIPAPAPTPMVAPKIPGANETAGDAAKALGAGDAAAAYGVPKASKASSPSIFDGEYDPTAFGGS